MDFQWKMSCNTDPSNQAQEIIFSRKTKKIIVLQTPYQNHLGIFFDTRLTFQRSLKVITTKVNKTIELLQKLQITLLRPVLTSDSQLPKKNFLFASMVALEK